MELIARERELAEVIGRVAEGRRLLSIVGPGGIGKTTLARAAQGALAPRYPMGAHTVELSRIDRADAVAGALAAQLGFSSFDVLLGSPIDLPALLLVDNCEHVADAAAEAVTALLDACGAVTVLATSRSPLAVPGESIVALAPLSIPPLGAIDARTGAVRLFCERARDGGVTIADDELDQVSELCHRLDGMPLAIELAAARLRVLTLGDVLRRLGDGIDVLQRPRHRGSVRHRSLRDTIEWSATLLDDDDRAAFARLGICVGPMTSDLAAAVIGVAPPDAVDVVDRLVDASLLVVERDPATSAATPYRMLEPIRAAALDHLARRGEVEAARERLACHVFDATVTMMEEATHTWGPDLLPTLIARFDQIDVALRHCLERDEDPTRAQVLYAVLWGTVHQARVDEVLHLGELVMARWPDTSATHSSDAMATYAMGKLLCGHVEEAEVIASRALHHTEGSWAAATGLRRVLGLAARYRGDHARAEELLGRAAAAAADGGLVTMDLECRVYRAQDLAALGRDEEALQITRAVAAEAVRRRSILNEIWARTVEASVLAARSSPDADGTGHALDDAAATLAAAEAIAYPFGVTCNLQTMAVCRLRAGDPRGAAASADRLLDAVARSGAGDFRRALDVTTAVLLAAGHPAAGDLAVTARRLPDTNPMVLPLDIPLTAASGGRPLDRPAATRAARRALAEVMAAPTAAPPPPPAPGVGTAGSAVFVRAGDLWEVGFGDVTVHLQSSKGMEDLAALLRQPGREVHCIELAGASVEEPTTGDVIDASARRRYEARVRALQQEIDEADAFNDRGRAERAEAELNAIVDHLTAALGLAGKARKQGGTAERARSAVTHRIRGAVRRIAEVHPPLGRHLEVSVSTGTYCRYQPEQPVHWTT